VVIQIGGNDIIRFTDLDAVKTNLDELLTKAKRLSSHVVLLHSGNVGLAPFFPVYIAPLFSWRTRQVRDIYIELAKAHQVVYIDLYTSHHNDPFSPNFQEFYAADLLHLNGEGYGVWYTRIRQYMDNNAIVLQAG
jgi:lysophospholipase L1-like esterase